MSNTWTAIPVAAISSVCIHSFRPVQIQLTLGRKRVSNTWTAIPVAAIFIIAVDTILASNPKDYIACHTMNFVLCNGS